MFTSAPLSLRKVGCEEAGLSDHGFKFEILVNTLESNSVLGLLDAGVIVMLKL